MVARKAPRKPIKPKPGTPDYFDQIEKGRRNSNAQSQYNRVFGRGPSAAEQMRALQAASRGNPAPRGGVTGRLEGHNPQGTGGKSYSPFKTPPMITGKGAPTPTRLNRTGVEKVGRGGGIRFGTRRGFGER